MDYLMELESRNIMMEVASKELLLMELRKDQGYILGKMEQYLTMGCFRMDKLMEMELFLRIRNNLKSIKEDLRMEKDMDMEG